MKCPCKRSCPDRHLGCRALCEAFKEYEAEYLAEKMAPQDVGNVTYASAKNYNKSMRCQGYGYKHGCVSE